MKKLSFILSFLLLTSCGVKHTRSLLTSGNYDDAIDIATNNLRSNKDKKGNQDYVYIIEEAFAKAKDRDLNSINLLENDSNPTKFEKIYNTYIQLDNRQEKIKPLLPLKLLKEGRNAKFPLDNYNSKIIYSKNNLSNYLYNNSKNLLTGPNKMNYRKAYDDLNYLNQINPNYKDVNNLIEEAHFKGTDFVLVTTKNQTNLIIPSRLQNDLLDFNTFGLNDIWTVYHNSKQNKINYDYGMNISLREIYISPEQIKEKEFVKEKQIKDGQKKLLDANNKEVLDKDGKVVMVDILKNVTVRINEFKQFKSCQITAIVDYVNLENNQLMQSFPLTSEFVFENIYSSYKGDKRASDDNYFPYFDKRAILFPSNEQMVYDTGLNLKSKIKDIIKRNQFRK
ncbi:hypothetical protein [Flavobacterium soyangense]|uniref:Lipoprotein n=1 Tax=Flavobacterium soyangense TaxID=2023265 RepID=A0A930UE19_9FLAO|nr:hypothetical protein [Flavobacterium soyangense]MBF2709704.1 hypothetical protein [Flavobacterium soyangense]